MIKEKKCKIKITDNGTPCADLPSALYSEATMNEFGEVRLCIELENLGTNIVTITEDDICVFERPDGIELMAGFEEEPKEKIRILPGYRRAFYLRIMESCAYPVLSINDNRDSRPEQLIEFEIVDRIEGDDIDDSDGGGDNDDDDDGGGGDDDDWGSSIFDELMRERNEE